MAVARRVLPALLLLTALVAAPTARAAPGGVAWRDWSPESFAKAKAERRIVVVEVSAAWCHWCHVMERETYGDPRVAQVIVEKFLPVKVDADARPDLAERFAEYHWPATVFLTPDGRPVTALRGFRDAETFLGILARVLAAVRDGRTLTDVDPPGGTMEATNGGGAFLPALRIRLEAFLTRIYDTEQGGWGFGQKYPSPGPLEHALLKARTEADAARSEAWRAVAEFTLAQQESLLDPVWGGMYQYSEGGVWDRPHFEKIMAVNAGAMSNYASAARRSRDGRWLRDAMEIRRYLTTFLRAPSGAFYTSQDADVGAHDGGEMIDGHRYFPLDDAGRRALGMPRIDTAIYAQENGWAIRALCELYRTKPDASILGEASRAADAVLKTHRDSRGGFRHGASDGGVLYLGDQAAMGHALLALSQVSGDARWRDEAVRTADFLRTVLLDAKRGGFLAHTEDPTAVGMFRERLRPFDANVAAARFLLALYAATDEAVYRTEALRALEAISDVGLAERMGARAGDYLVAVEEATFPWLHVAVVGTRGDAAEAAMWAAALALHDSFTSIERLAPGTASAAGGATYPPSARPRAFVCGGGRCSDPVTDPAKLAAMVRSFRSK